MLDVAVKWGKPVAERGFAQVPNYLLMLNRFLEDERRLGPAELLALIQLVGNWWKKDALPFPSIATLAVRCGVSDRQMQRTLNKLVKVGLLGRTPRRGEKGIRATNAYDLQPLVTMLGVVAKVFPNDFPRNIDRAKIREVSSFLQLDETVSAERVAKPAEVADEASSP